MDNILAAIGEALIDFIPDKSGCPFDEIGSFAPKVGGAPANVCAAYSALGGKSRMITQLGDDLFGHRIIRRLDEVGVDTSCISLTDKANTALAFVTLKENGDREFSFYRNPSADMLMPPEAVKEEFFDGVSVLHFCSVDIGDFLMKQAHLRAIDIMRKKGGIISFDPNLRFNLWQSKEALKNAVREFIPLSDIVKLSEDELEFVTGTADPEQSAAWLFSQGVSLALITMGSKGAYAFTKTSQGFSPAKPVKAIDTTGAGDGFTGAFLWKLGQKGTTKAALEKIPMQYLCECLDFANSFCAVSVQKKGAIASYPTAEQMRQINQN